MARRESSLSELPLGMHVNSRASLRQTFRVRRDPSALDVATVGRAMPNHTSSDGSAKHNHPSSAGRAKPNHTSSDGRAKLNHPSPAGRAKPNHNTSDGRAKLNYPPSVGRAPLNHNPLASSVHRESIISPRELLTSVTTSSVTNELTETCKPNIPHISPRESDCGMKRRYSDYASIPAIFPRGLTEYLAFRDLRLKSRLHQELAWYFVRKRPEAMPQLKSNEYSERTVHTVPSRLVITQFRRFDQRLQTHVPVSSEHRARHLKLASRGPHPIRA